MTHLDKVAPMRLCTLPITLKEFVDLKKSSSQDEVARFATNFGCLHYS
jgi:hypothetical protein